MKKVFLLMLVPVVAMVTMSFKSKFSEEGTLLRTSDLKESYLVSTQDFNYFVESGDDSYPLQLINPIDNSNMVRLCPGSGMPCTLHISSSDGTTYIYRGTKGKGRRDIEIILRF